jgi:hypothetical protein
MQSGNFHSTASAGVRSLIVQPSLLYQNGLGLREMSVFVFIIKNVTIDDSWELRPSTYSNFLIY